VRDRSHHTIDYRTQDFRAVLKEQLGERGVDVILDLVGAPYLERPVGG